MRDAALARPHQGCSVASVAWTSAGALYVSVVVKATLALRDGGPSALVTAAPVETQDRFTTRDERGSLIVARDLFPYRPRVDVTLIGHAQLPAGGVGVARLAVRGEGGWFDKRLEVRPPPTRGRTALPTTRVPLGWEATWADDENPVGVPRGSLAWILDPEQPGKGVGFGPVAAHWARRASTLGGIDAGFLESDAPRFPDAFDWEFFHAAPVDQQLAWIDGTETIELDGLLDRTPTLRTSLPHLAAAAWAFAPWEVGEGQPLDLVADGLAIDADRGLAHVVWRATYPLLSEEWSLSQLQILASVEARAAPAAATSLVSVPAARRSSASSGLGLGARPAPPVAVPVHPAASLFDTDDGDEQGTRPLTRKELLAAMAKSGKALPFNSAKPIEQMRTSELEVPEPPPGSPPPAPPPAPSAPRVEQTRPIPHDAIFGADGDHGTVAGDDDELAGAASVSLPAFLRTESPRSMRAALDTDLDSPSAVSRRQTPEQDDAAFADDETHASDDPGQR
jgi:hypothetical protein